MGRYSGSAVAAELVLCFALWQCKLYLSTLLTSHVEIVCELEIARNLSPSCLCCPVLSFVC